MPLYERVSRFNRFDRMAQLFWPIQSQEYRNFLPLFFLSFFITLVYNLGKSLKITLLVTAPGSSAEVLPFVQSWAVMPASIGMTLLYFYLINRYSRESVFAGIVLIFIAFFLSFTFFLYPFREQLEPKWLLHFLKDALPESLGGLILMIKLWPSTLFYILAELWTTTMYAMLFWGLANETTTLSQAKRFYPLFSFAANSAGILAAPLVVLLTLNQPMTWLSFAGEKWEQSLTLYVFAMLGASVCILLLLLPLIRQEKQTTIRINPNQAKPKLSFLLSFKTIFANQHLFAITVLVMAYNWVYNLSEMVLLHYLHQKFPEPLEFNNYLNWSTLLTSIAASLSALLFSGTVLRYSGWRIAAWVSPLVWGGTGLIFFVAFYLDAYTQSSNPWLPAGAIALMFGSAQYCLGRACKYSFFDDTKEMAFIPLDTETQRLGKAAIDGVGSRFGKASSAWVCQILFIVFQGISSTIPMMMLLVLFALLAWFWAVEKLNRNLTQYNAISTEELEEVPLGVEAPA